MWSVINTPSGTLFHRFGLLKLAENNVSHNACIVYKVAHQLNLRLFDLYPICYPLHPHVTRKKYLIRGKKGRLKSTRFSAVCREPQIWNELDDNIKTSHSFSIFKKNLKSHFFYKHMNNTASLNILFLFSFSGIIFD